MPLRKTKEWGKIKPPAGASVDWGDPISHRLISYLLMSEGGGALVKDIAKKNNGAMASSATWGMGQFGKVPSFNGTSTSYISGTSLLGGATEFSISLWVAIRNNTTQTIMHGNTTYSGSYYCGVDIGATGYAPLQFYVGSLKLASASNLYYGRWYHVVFTFSGNPKESAIWINGVRDAVSNSASLPTSVASHTGFEIGVDTANTNYYLNGLVDNVRTYNRVLKGSEIQRLFNRPFAGIVPPRIGMRQSASGATTIAVSHTTDALLKATSTKTHTTDALLRTTYTKTHTSDAFLKATATRTHTTDALLKSTSTKAHATDSLLKATATKTHTTDSLLKSTATKTHTTDAILKATSTKSHTTDSFLKATSTVSHTTDASLKGTFTKSHTTDAYLYSATTKTVSHTTDAFLKAARTKVHTTDALLKKPTTQSHNTDTLLKLASTQSHTTDSLLQKSNTVSHSTDAYITEPDAIYPNTDRTIETSSNKIGRLVHPSYPSRIIETQQNKLARTIS